MRNEFLPLLRYYLNRFLTNPTLIVLLVFSALLMALILVRIGKYVWRDASERCMEPKLWVIITVISPFFIGLILYLLIRNGSSDYKCGCGYMLDADWKLCPMCAAPLPEKKLPPRKRDKKLNSVIRYTMLTPFLITAIILSASITIENPTEIINSRSNIQMTDIALKDPSSLRAVAAQAGEEAARYFSNARLSYINWYVNERPTEGRLIGPKLKKRADFYFTTPAGLFGVSEAVRITADLDNGKIVETETFPVAGEVPPLLDLPEFSDLLAAMEKTPEMAEILALPEDEKTIVIMINNVFFTGPDGIAVHCYANMEGYRKFVGGKYVDGEIIDLTSNFAYHPTAVKLQ